MPLTRPEPSDLTSISVVRITGVTEDDINDDDFKFAAVQAINAGSVFVLVKPSDITILNKTRGSAIVTYAITVAKDNTKALYCAFTTTEVFPALLKRLQQANPIFAESTITGEVRHCSRCPVPSCPKPAQTIVPPPDGAASSGSDRSTSSVPTAAIVGPVAAVVLIAVVALAVVLHRRKQAGPDMSTLPPAKTAFANPMFESDEAGNPNPVFDGRPVVANGAYASFDSRPVQQNGAYASVDPRLAQQNGAYHDVMGGVGSLTLDESDEETGYQELDGAHVSQDADTAGAGYQDLAPYEQPVRTDAEAGYMEFGDDNYDNVEHRENGYAGVQMDGGYARANAPSDGLYDQPGNLVMGDPAYDQPNPPLASGGLYDNPEHTFLRRDSRA